MFGLSWYAPQAAVLRRFEGLSPAAIEDEAVVYRLDALAAWLAARGIGCPRALASSPERHDEAVFHVPAGGLAEIRIGFGYAFESIGQKPENLSDSVMTAYARGEFAGLVQDLATRHGAPIMLSEQMTRLRNLYLIGTALFRDPDGTVLRTSFGHDGGALAGELLYLPPQTEGTGF